MIDPEYPLKHVMEDALRGHWQAVAEGFSGQGPSKLLDITVDLSDLTAPRCEILQTSTLHLGGLGQHYVNGMVTSALLDLSIGITGLNYVQEGFFATSSININFQKPLESGHVYAVSRCRQREGKNLLVDATVYNGSGEPRVVASGTVRVGIKASS